MIRNLLSIGSTSRGIHAHGLYAIQQNDIICSSEGSISPHMDYGLYVTNGATVTPNIIAGNKI